MASFAGSFLVAKPILQEPTFRQTVILLLQHNREGAFGLVVNRPVSGDGLPFPIFSGGPCEAQGFIMLHGQSDWAESEPDKKTEVAPGIYLGDASCLRLATDSSPGVNLRYRVFSGYAGWGPDQLEGELAAGAWAVVPAKAEALFDTPIDEIWHQLIPPSIPEPSLN